MNTTMLRLAIGLGATTLCTQAFAVTEYDPFDMKAVLASAEKKAIESGTSALTDVAKSLLGAAANSYMPGLGTMLGLSAPENNATQQIIDAITVDGNKTRDLISAFWDWAIAANEASLAAKVAALHDGIQRWNAIDPRARIGNRDQLADLLARCDEVLAMYMTRVTAFERVLHLHAYATIMDLAVVLEAELAEVNHVGGLMVLYGASGVQDWWAEMTPSEQGATLAEITDLRRNAAWRRLQSGIGTSFHDYLAQMDAAGDFTAARDWQFSPLTSDSCTGGICSTPSAVYYIGNDPQGRCQDKSKCKAFSIRGGTSTCPGGFRFYVDFDNNGRVCYKDGVEAYEEHKALVLREMIIRGYGPVRALAEKWWDSWGFGWRNRVGLDDVLDGYIDAATNTPLITYKTLDSQLTEGGLTVGEKGYLRGFALGWGTSAANDIALTATSNPDWLANWTLLTVPNASSYTLSKFSSSVHLSAMRGWPMTSVELVNLYRGQAPAKLSVL